MRVHLACIGRLKSGPERDLFDRYADRARKAGRALGLTFSPVIELPEARGPRAEDRKAAEAEALLAALPAGAVILALDEGGKTMTSERFARMLEQHKDTGSSDFALVIGGPDGHGEALLRASRMSLALGPMTWPHQIARVLICEQVYRAITILSGHPYHRT